MKLTEKFENILTRAMDQEVVNNEPLKVKWFCAHHHDLYHKNVVGFSII